MITVTVSRWIDGFALRFSEAVPENLDEKLVKALESAGLGKAYVYRKSMVHSEDATSLESIRLPKDQCLEISLTSEWTRRSFYREILIALYEAMGRPTNVRVRPAGIFSDNLENLASISA